MSSEGRKFRAWVVRREPETAFSLDKLIEQFAQDVLGKSPALAAAYAAANRIARWRDILRLQDDLELRGAAPLLVDVDSATRTASYLVRKPSSGVIRRERAVRCGARPSLLRSMDALGSRHYEALACVVASSAGAERTHLTPPGNEGGIDFFALIKSPGRCHVFSESRSPIRVIGQCKKYESAVGVDKVRQFVHSISSVCQQSLLVEKHVPAWFRDASGPVVGWMIGHSGFQSGAITVARNHGIVLSDTLDLAEVCAQSRRFPAPSSTVDYSHLIRSAIDAELAK